MLMGMVLIDYLVLLTGTEDSDRVAWSGLLVFAMFNFKHLNLLCLSRFIYLYKVIHQDTNIKIYNQFIYVSVDQNNNFIIYLCNLIVY